MRHAEFLSTPSPLRNTGFAGKPGKARILRLILLFAATLYAAAPSQHGADADSIQKAYSRQPQQPRHHDAERPDPHMPGEPLSAQEHVDKINGQGSQHRTHNKINQHIRPAAHGRNE